jgi:hypothetical protein
MSLPALKRGRGRPKGSTSVRRVRKTHDTVAEYMQRTGASRSTVNRRMKTGKLKFVQDVPGGLRRIPHSEYGRVGYEIEEA